MKNSIYTLRKQILNTPSLYCGLYPDYSEYGKFRIEKDSYVALKHTSNLIQTALMDCESSNPFEVLGINFDLIFSINTPTNTDIISTSIMELMKQFSDRIEVRKLNVRNNPEEGTSYVDMELFYKPLQQVFSLNGLRLGG